MNWYGITYETKSATRYIQYASVEAAMHRMAVLLEDGVKTVHLTRNGYHNG